MKKKSKISFWVTLVVLIVFNALPYIWMILNSFKTQNEIFKAKIFPDTFNLDNYIQVLGQGGFLTNIWNSFIVSSVSTLICIIIGIPAAYAFARLRFRYKNVLFMLVLFITIFPGIFIISPLYTFMANIGAIDTHFALILPYVAYFSPLVVWILTSFFEAIPPSIEEMAIMDGASFINVITKVLMPLALPGIITVGIIAFTMSWNEFMFALVFTSSDAAKTVPVAIAHFQGINSLNWGQMTTAAVIATLPLVLVSVFLQKYVISGLTSGAVKE